MNLYRAKTDRRQKGILLRRTVCVEQSSRISESRHAYLGLF